MPTYQYACTACDERLEAVQSFSDAALTECPACHGRLRKVFSAVGVVFKGSGFYKNDSREAVKSGTVEGRNGAEKAGDGGTSGAGAKESSAKGDATSAGSGSGGTTGTASSSGSDKAGAGAGAGSSSGTKAAATSAPAGKPS